MFAAAAAAAAATAAVEELELRDRTAPVLMLTLVGLDYIIIIV